MYRTEYSPYTRTDTWASGATTIHNGETGDKDDKDDKDDEDDEDDEDDDASVALAAIISRARRNTSARSFRFCFFASSSDTCRRASRNAATTTDVACCPFLVTGYRPSRTAAPPVASAAHHGCKKGASERVSERVSEEWRFPPSILTYQSRRALQGVQRSHRRLGHTRRMP